MSRLQTRIETAGGNALAMWNRIRAQLELAFPLVNSRFRTFTLHDASHALALEAICDWLVPEAVIEEVLNEYEVLALLSAIWGHDIGMAATDEEVRSYCEGIDVDFPCSPTEMQGFIRDHHPELGAIALRRIVSSLPEPEAPSVAQVVARVAQSHGEYKLDRMPTALPVGLGGNSVRQVYIAVLVRLADILHCTADRAPMNLFKTRCIDDEEAARHWRGHNANLGIGPGQGTEIAVSVATTDFLAFEWTEKYIDHIQCELDYCSSICGRSNLGSPYFRLNFARVTKHVDTPFLPELLRISFDVPAAVAALTGRSLYDDESVVIRELVQNALDACSLRRRREAAIRPEIVVRVDHATKTLQVSDNGLGMTLDDVRGRLLTSCTSGFRRADTNGSLIARFGVGFLTTLMVGGEVTVETRHHDVSREQGLRIRIVSAADAVRADRLEVQRVGTTVTVALRDGVRFSGADLVKWIPRGQGATTVELILDGQSITGPTEEQPVAEDGYSYDCRDYVYNGEDYSVRFRSSLLRNPAGMVWPCGLSFQQVGEHDRSVLGIPDVKGRLSVAGIPVVDRAGQRPPYRSSGEAEPTFLKIYGPFDLDVTRPGAAELNVARNALLAGEVNSRILTSAGIGAATLIRDFFEDLASTGQDRSALATVVASEFWLSRLSGNGDRLFQASVSEDTEAIEILRPLWNELTCLELLRTGARAEVKLGDLAGRGTPVLLCALPLAQALASSRYDWRRLFRSLDTIHAGVSVVIDIGSAPGRKFGPSEVLLTLCRSVALWDPTSAGIQHPALLLFHLDDEDAFPAATPRSAQVFGTDKLFCGFLHLAPGVCWHSGGRQQRVIVNLGAREEHVAELRTEFLVEPHGTLHVPGSQRQSTQEWLRSCGVPASLITTDTVHEVLGRAFATIGPGSLALPMRDLFYER